jgi:hypothetical protein
MFILILILLFILCIVRDNELTVSRPVPHGWTQSVCAWVFRTTYSTVQYSTVQSSTVQYSTVQEAKVGSSHSAIFRPLPIFCNCWPLLSFLVLEAILSCHRFQILYLLVTVSSPSFSTQQIKWIISTILHYLKKLNNILVFIYYFLVFNIMIFYPYFYTHILIYDSLGSRRSRLRVYRFHEDPWLYTVSITVYRICHWLHAESVTVYSIMRLYTVSIAVCTIWDCLQFPLLSTIFTNVYSIHYCLEYLGLYMQFQPISGGYGTVYSIHHCLKDLDCLEYPSWTRSENVYMQYPSLSSGCAWGRKGIFRFIDQNRALQPILFLYLTGE